MEKNKFYITTPIYYANAKPHIGHAYTTVAADILARFHKLQKKEVFFLTGMDEHGIKIQKTAKNSGKDPQVFVDEISEEFKKLWSGLNIEYSNFIRTTNSDHKKAVQNTLQALYEKGAVYKGKYEGLYCIGCEQFKNESDLKNNKCPDHGIEPELLKEDCYLLKLSEIQSELIRKISKDEFKIMPERYKDEIFSFLKKHKLKNISISRKSIEWGIPLPFDPEHTTYVWVDAFLNYLTGLGWNGDIKNIPKQWPADVQIIGKDILRVHATIWPAILLHLRIKLPKVLFTHGHIISDGKKMSKTLGNVIAIEEMLEKFGIDGTRYLLLSMGKFGEDLDMTMERLIEKYNADLANGLGNLLSRVIKLSQNLKNQKLEFNERYEKQFIDFFEKIELEQALNYIFNIVRKDNKYIEDNKPWELVKSDEQKFTQVMRKLIDDLLHIAFFLVPFMPETSEKIKKALKNKKVKPLFQRIKFE